MGLFQQMSIHFAGFALPTVFAFRIKIGTIISVPLYKYSELLKCHLLYQKKMCSRKCDTSKLQILSDAAWPNIELMLLMNYVNR